MNHFFIFSSSSLPNFQIASPKMASIKLIAAIIKSAFKTQLTPSNNIPNDIISQPILTLLFLVLIVRTMPQITHSIHTKLKIVELITIKHFLSSGEQWGQTICILLHEAR